MNVPDNPTKPQNGTDPLMSVSSGSERSLLRAGVIDPPLRPGTIGLLGHFELLCSIGTGGMGVVFLARDTTNSRRVAIKVLKPELVDSPLAVQRFLREAKLMQALSHPNILPVDDVADRVRGPYFVMPLAERGSLAAYIKSHGPMDTAEGLDAAIQIAEALAYCHRRGVVHHDIKPGNVLIGPNGQLLLCDLGLGQPAGDVSASYVEQDKRIGTAAYMAPEIVRGEAGDARCDVYAFGATLYEMLTGQPPYSGATAQEVFAAAQARPPEPVETLAPKANRHLAAIAQRAMACALRDRYASMDDVLSDLHRVQAGRNPLGPHGKAPFGLRFVSRRERRIAVAVAVAALALGLAALARAVFWPASTILRVEREIALPGVIDHWHRALTGDWHADGEPELFLSNDTDLFVVSLHGEILRRHRFLRGEGANLGLTLLADIDGDGKDEIVLGWSEGENLFAGVLNQNMYVTHRFRAEGTIYDGRGGQNQHSNIIPRLIEDLDGNGRRTLIASIGTAYGRRPRAIVAFDFETAEMKWRYDTGGHVHDVFIADLTLDGRKEVVFTTMAVGNGNVAPDGTDDFTAYVTALDSGGQVVWMRALSRFPSSAEALPVKLGGEAPSGVLAWVRSDGEWYDGPSPVVLFDGRGNELARYEAGANIASCLTADLNGDGLEEMLVTDQRGFVHVIDHRLHPKRKVRLAGPSPDGVLLRVEGIVPAGRRGGPYVVFTSSLRRNVSGHNPGFDSGPANVRTYNNNVVMLTDSEMRIVETHTVADHWKRLHTMRAMTLPVAGGQAKKLLVLADRAIVMTIEQR